MKKQNKSDLWIRICLVPLLMGGSLVISNISMIIFRVAGWILLIFGLVTGLFYLIKLYRTHRKKILEFLMKVYLIKWRKIE